jgi:hypothetical protein
VTEYTVLFNPSKKKGAQELTKFAAIDVMYDCPKCNSARVFTWLFPEVGVTFRDNCCGEEIVLEPTEEE